MATTGCDQTKSDHAARRSMPQGQTAALGSLVGRSHPLLAAAAERPFTKLPALANCSVTSLRWPGPELVAFNETAHLGPEPDGVPQTATDAP